MDPLQVLLLGGFQLRRRAMTIPPIPSRAARSLLAYLVVDRGVHHPRERVATEFWPDLPAGRARRRLSHTLWQVQDALGDLAGDVTYIEVTGETLGFDPTAPLWLDVEEFENGLDRAQARQAKGVTGAADLTELERTVSLYQGDFLAGHYDAWITAEQQRLHQRYLDAVSWLIALAKGQGSYHDALMYAKRLTYEDPLREDGHREVMRLSVVLGRTSDAIRQYERCREVLADELGTAPSAATTELYERVVREEQTTTPPIPAELAPFPQRIPLIGREQEREAGIGVIERALGGRGGAVLVEGDAGVGKSRLLSELVDDAHWRGFTSMRASCRHPEGMAPYAVVTQLLEGILTPLRVEQLRHRVSPVWLGEAARLVPALARAGPQAVARLGALHDAEGAQRIRDAVVQVLGALADIDPLLIVVDDLQWSDAESLGVLEFLAGELRDRPLALLVGYRGDDARNRPRVWNAIRGIDRRMRPDRLVLSPLEASATAELVRALGRGHAVDGAVAARLQRETGGNPLFVVETLRALSEDELLSLLEGDEGEQLPLPQSIRQLVLDRLDRLSKEEREVLDLAAIAGDGVDLDTLATASELPREVVVDAADTLVRRSLLVQTSEAFALHHDQVRRTTLDALTVPRVRALHRRVGRALQGLQPDAIERLAHHFVEGDLPSLAAGYLRQAGRKATDVHAYEAADGYYRQAVEQQSRRPAKLSDRFELLAEYEAVLAVVGDRDAQRRVLDELVVLADGEPVRQVEAARRHALLSGHLGDTEVALASGQQAVDAAEELGDPDLLAPSLIALASVLTWAGRRAEAVAVLGHAADVAPGTWVEVQARTQLGSVLRELQRYEEAVEHLTIVLRLAREHAGLPEEAAALGVLGTIRMETGHSEQAISLYGRAIDRCVAIGFRRGEGVHRVNRATARYMRAEIGEALDDYAAAGRIFASIGDRRGEAMVQLNHAVLQHTIVGDDDVARSQLDQALAFFTEVGDRPFAGLCHDSLAGIELRASRRSIAEYHVEQALLAADAADDAWVRAQALQRRVELALSIGDSGGALADVADAVATATSHGLADLLPMLRALEGEARLARGEVDAALDATTQAVASLRPGVERGYLVRYRHYLALDAAGNSAEARTAAEQALGELRRALSGLDDASRERALGVPEHRWIAQAADGVARVQRVLTVVGIDVPLGRPLGEADLVTVTVDLEPDRDAPDDAVERRRWLLQRVVDQIRAQGGAPTHADLAAVLDVSEVTVRRDLGALREDGIEVETRGHRTA